MAVWMGALRHEDPREYGYRSAVAGGTPAFFMRKCVGLDEWSLDLAIEGWNEFQDEGGDYRAGNRIGISGDVLARVSRADVRDHGIIEFFDAEDRAVLVAWPNGQWRVFEYDDRGRQTFYEAPLAAVTK